MKSSIKLNNLTHELSNKTNFIIKLIGFYEIFVGLWSIKFILDSTIGLGTAPKASAIFFIFLSILSIASGALLFLRKKLGYILSLTLQSSQILATVCSGTFGLYYSFLFGPELTSMFAHYNNLFHVSITLYPHLDTNGLFVNTSTHSDIYKWALQINLLALSLAIVLLQVNRSFSFEKFTHALRKVIATSEILTGLFSILVLLKAGHFHFGNNMNMLLTISVSIAIYVTSFCAGILLWKNKLRGYKLSILIQAFQIIGIDLPSFTFTMLPIPSIFQKINSLGTSLHFNLDRNYSWFNFFSESAGVEPTLFINYLSIAFLLILVYQYRHKRILDSRITTHNN